MTRTQPRYAIVIPTAGRPELGRLLAALEGQEGLAAEEIVVVDDRAVPTPPLAVPGTVAGAPARVLTSGGRGPAAARNTGWRAVPVSVPWVVFLDDDVVPAAGWARRLATDLTGAPDDMAGSQALIEVPAPTDRRPRDGERATLALASARWITADLAYRRSVLREVGGFDERFTRAYREDTDLALRVMNTGRWLARGSRRTLHPTREADTWASVRAQRGNADDVALRRRHGPRWRGRVGERRGRFRRHVAATTALALGLVLGGLAAHRPRLRRSATAVLLVWAALTAEFAAHRILAGPRAPREIAVMLATSVAIPPAACAHRVAGEIRHRDVWPDCAGSSLPAAVLFDRDGTLVHDVAYNGDPELVRPVEGARRALDRLRGLGVRVGVVSNQSGLARGVISPAQLRDVNERVTELLGPFDVWRVCPHGEDTGCRCRKPAPGLVLSAAAALGVAAGECVVIGDTGGDVMAARAAGARGILVPNGRTRPQEREGAPEVAVSVEEAVAMALRGCR